MFVIQNGHNMTAATTWAISGSGSKLWVEDGGTLTAPNAVTLATATTFQIDAGGTYVHNNTTAYGSSIFRGTEVFDAASNVILNNSNTTGPSGVTFGNLTINLTSDPGGSINSSGGLTTIDGNFTVVSTSTREFRFVANTPATLTITIAKDLVIQGGKLNISSGTSTPTINLGGNFNQTGGTLTTTGVSAIIFTGGTPSVTFTQSAGTLTSTNINWQVANGKTVTFNNAFTIAALRSMTVDSGGILATANGITNNGTFSVNGTFQINNGGFVGGTAPTYASASTLKYNSGGTYGRSTEWSATSNPGYPGNVQVSNNTTLNYPNGSVNARSIAGNLTIDSGSALYMDYGSPGLNNPLTVAGNLSLDGAFSLGDAIGGDLYLGGNWSNNGTFYPNSRAVFFNGSGAQAITGATTFDYLTLNNSNGLALNNDITVNQTLTLTSGNINTGANTLFHSGACSGAGDVIGTVSRSDQGATARCFGNENNQITFGSGIPTGSVTVKLDQSTPGGFASNVVKRYYTITSNAWSGASATLRLRYLESELPSFTGGKTESDLVLFKRTTGAYMEKGGAVDTSANYVELANIDSFSNWAFAAAGTPTSAILGRFRAQATPKHQVRVKWNTEAEWNVVGFNLYRQTAGRKKWTKLNGDTPIERKDVSSPDGARYKWNDKQVKAGKTYRYKLEILKVSGPAEWSEVVQVTVP
ncbi:hypothetical protein FBQ82_14090 [Anaerolineae bacterium CFX7]|nr:hypothetical protein [Anaerolineae bacterium CFX7]